MWQQTDRVEKCKIIPSNNNRSCVCFSPELMAGHRIPAYLGGSSGSCPAKSSVGVQNE